MKKNLGTADRIIRIILTVVFAVLYYLGIISGFAGIVLLILGGVFLGTSLSSFCPLYTLFGIDTNKIEHGKS